MDDVNVKTKEYVIEVKSGSKVYITIKVKIENLHNTDLEEILHEYAVCTHNFYLDLANKIVKKS